MEPDPDPEWEIWETRLLAEVMVIRDDVVVCAGDVVVVPAIREIERGFLL